MKDVLTTSGLVLCAIIGAGALATACGSDNEATTDDGGVEGGTGFGNLDGGATADGFAGCATSTKKAEKLPVDMVIGLDTSFSMDFDSKWTNVRAALKSFVGNPANADLGLALQFFPVRKQCSVSDYATPAVLLGLQPVNASPITAALDAQQMAGGTPMVPLLEGLTQYLQAKGNSARKPIIVLATDGVPDDTCLADTATSKANTIENAVLVAGQAFKGTPSIPTFVIGVGSELTALNAIGQAGGTGNAILVDTAADAQGAFLKALDNIRKAAVPCDFPLPVGSTIDVATTNVTSTSAAGVPKTYVSVGTRPAAPRPRPTAGTSTTRPSPPRSSSARRHATS